MNREANTNNNDKKEQPVHANTENANAKKKARRVNYKKTHMLNKL